jgi:ABC-2 type transport system permease protein
MTLGKTLRSAYVVGRRDFVATVYSKTFLFFLLGPLFPILMGLMFGGLGQRAERNAPAATVAVVASPADFALIDAARTRFAPFANERPLVTVVREQPEADVDSQLKRLLASDEEKLLGVLTGGLANPRFTGDVDQDGRTIKQMGMFVDEAQRMQKGMPVGGKPMTVTLADQSGGSLAFARSLTARIGQFLLFFLTVFLAGMLLSQLIEEKSNKIIEVLAASIPIDAVFLGKLFAMLVMSLIGITVWLTAGALGIQFYNAEGLLALPPPAVGWPAFIALGVIYFTLNYLLIGATFLGIGAQASTVREVQTLSMPVTMAQMVLFGLAQLAIGQPNSTEGITAAIFPLSSPFAMIARAAEVETLWPHLLAIAWQVLWVVLIVRLSARLFRRAVLKSGPAFRWPWQRKALA